MIEANEYPGIVLWYRLRLFFFFNYIWTLNYLLIKHNQQINLEKVLHLQPYDICVIFLLIGFDYF